MIKRWQAIRVAMNVLDQKLLPMRAHRLALLAAKSEGDTEVLLDIESHRENLASSQKLPFKYGQFSPSPANRRIPDPQSLSSSYSDDSISKRRADHGSTGGAKPLASPERRRVEVGFDLARLPGSELGPGSLGAGNFMLPGGAHYDDSGDPTTRTRDAFGSPRTYLSTAESNTQAGLQSDAVRSERFAKRLGLTQDKGSESAKIQTPDRIVDRTPRPPSPAGSLASVGSTASHARRRSLIPVASPSMTRRQLRPDHYGIPPVPGLPDRTAIAAMERASTLRSVMQTPEPTLRQRATEMPFYAGKSRVVTPSRIGSTTDTYFPPSRSSTPLGQRRSSAASSRAAPSAWKDQHNPRPTSSMSTSVFRSGAMTPLPPTTIRKGFVPNPLDLLDVELAKVLDSTPNDVIVERLDPPLRRGHRHEGEWTAQYAFTSGRHGRQVLPSRLLELHKPRSGVEGKTRKIMVKTEGLWRDLRLVLLELA